MKTTLISAVVAYLSAAMAYGQCNDPPGSDPSVSGLIMVRVHDGVAWPDALAAITAQIPDITVVDASLASRNIYVLRVPLGRHECEVDDDLTNALVAPPGDPNRPLRWAETEYSSQGAEGHTGSVYDSGRANYAVGFPSQYLLTQVGATAALRLSRGGGITVAVLDTGIDASHPALSGFVRADGLNLVQEDGRAIDDTADVGDGVDSDGDGQFDELVGHGTFVAGLIHLIAPEAQLLPIVVLSSDGTSDSFTAVMGIYAALDAGVDVINCSFGSTFLSDVYEEALLEARDRGVLVIGAAGNRGLTGYIYREFPAATEAQLDPNLPDVHLGVAVAGVDPADLRMPSSSHYSAVHVSAPGASALLPDGSGAYDPARSIISTLPGGEFGVWEGTSFSTAVVSGAAALLVAQQSHLPRDAAYFGSMRGLLRTTGVEIDILNPDVDGEMGRRLDIAALLQARLPGDLDGDGVVTLQDLALLLSSYGLADPTADIDLNGLVDLQDLAILLSNFGL